MRTGVGKVIKKLAEIRELGRGLRENEFPPSDLSDFEPNEIRIGTRVVWAPGGMLEQFRARDRAIPGGLVVVPMDFPTEGVVVGIHPTAPIVTVRWPDESPRWGFERETRVIAGNLAVKGSLAACRESVIRADGSFRKCEPILIREKPEAPKPEKKKRPARVDKSVMPEWTIKWLVNRMHVSASDEDVREEITSKFNLSANMMEKAVRFALERHHENQREFAFWRF